uniref:NEBU n=1 Tax=Buteo japonicus TaxID=224669 RepID=A0A8C0BHR5_9AVES
GLGKATPTPVTPEMERVKRNQEQISSVLYKENLGRATPTPITPEMERVKRNQEQISSVVYKEGLGKATPTPVTPEMERVKRNQEQISSVLSGRICLVLFNPLIFFHSNIESHLELIVLKRYFFCQLTF